jgi:HD superfamily phosphohydrolase
MSLYNDIPEVGDAEADRGLIRIPVEQDVPFTRRVRALVDTAEFRRLGEITQLGLARLVYPGATHTRFEHALGVFHNAIRYLRQLGKDARFCRLIDAHHAELLLASALLHDLGHWPFCHPIEDMGLKGLPPHEQFAAEFLAPNRELAQVLRDMWHVEPEEVLDVLAPRTDSAPLRMIRSILSGPIDIDKMDYLDRDSLHAGVPYGRNFDKSRLIQSLVVNERGDGLAISSKGRTAAELMVFARYVMFGEVYWHHAVRSATSMFARAFYHLHDRFDLRAFFQMRESEVINFMRVTAAGTDCEELVEGLFGPKRILYKRVAEYSLYQNPEIYQKLARQTYEYLVFAAESYLDTARFILNVGPNDILIDAPPPHREVEFNVDIYYPKEDVYRPLHKVSPVVEALARTQFDDYVKRVRILAHPRIASEMAKADLERQLLERSSQINDLE